jgi:hypothetical protein
MIIQQNNGHHQKCYQCLSSEDLYILQKYDSLEHQLMSFVGLSTVNHDRDQVNLAVKQARKGFAAMQDNDGGKKNGI